jgi:hypothetical protein
MQRVRKGPVSIWYKNKKILKQPDNESKQKILKQPDTMKVTKKLFT